MLRTSMKAEKPSPGPVLSGGPPLCRSNFTPANLTEIRFHRKMQNVLHRCIEADLSIGGNMATMFTKDDAQTCCGCESNDPSFRLISLQLAPNNARSLVPECTATLLCQDCLKLELDDFHKSLDQIKKPIEEWESSEGRYLSREYGVLVVPLKLTYSESQLLIEELGTDGLERFLN